MALRIFPAGIRRSAATLSPAGDALSALPAHLVDRPNFIAAARHSRRVRFLRRAIPWGCAAIALFLVLRAFAGLVISNVGGLTAGFSIQDRKVVMDKPKLSGFKRDGSTYEMTAERAVQDLKTPNLVELHKLTARVQQGAQGWTNLTGDQGSYDSKAEKLDVAGNILVRTDSGTEAKLRGAKIDFKAGTVVSDETVEVRMSTGQVNANRMEVLDNGRKFVFEGQVRSEFVNNAPPAKPGT